MTNKQEKAIIKLLTYLCDTYDIPKSFKENPDILFTDSSEAKLFSGIYFHTSVRKDKFDWPKLMLNNIINEFNNTEKNEIKKSDVTISTETTNVNLSTNTDIVTSITNTDIVTSITNTDIVTSNNITTDTIVEKKSWLFSFINFFINLFK